MDGSSLVHGMVLGALLSGLIVGNCVDNERVEQRDIYERAMQYHLGKTPEEIKAIIQEERKREGR